MQAAVGQPRHLLSEAVRSHAYPVRVIGRLFDAVVHQDHRHASEANAVQARSHNWLTVAGRALLPAPSVASRGAKADAGWRTPHTKRATGPR